MVVAATQAIERKRFREPSRSRRTMVPARKGPPLRIANIRLSNSMTVEKNVLSGGSIGQIARNRTVNPATYEHEDRFFHYDQVGSVMTVTDADGELAGRRYADAFGNALEDWTTGLWAAPPASAGWGHNTKETDGGTGLVYMYQRWYLPHTGTFASQAPYPPMMEHEYGFAEGNPVMMVDPRGRQSFLFGAGKLTVSASCAYTDLSGYMVLPEDSGDLIPIPPNDTTRVPVRINPISWDVIDLPVDTTHEVDGLYGNDHILKIPDNAHCRIKCDPCGNIHVTCSSIQPPFPIYPFFFPRPEDFPRDAPPEGWPAYPEDLSS